MRQNIKNNLLIMLGVVLPISIATASSKHKTDYLTSNQDTFATKIFLLNRFGYGFNYQQLNDIQNQSINEWLKKQLWNEEDGLPQQAVEYLNNLHINQETDMQLLADFRNSRKEIDLLRKNAGDNPDQVTQEKLQKDIQKVNSKREFALEAISEELVYSLYGNNLLQNSMTDFWLNHFSVFSQKDNVAVFLGSYEKTIRSHSLGNFKDLLREVVTSPAMLVYLDNRLNTGDNIYNEKARQKNPKQSQGINENYAREFLELHTMGVNSGYTQNDVQELAKIFTGLGLLPENPNFSIPSNLQSLTVQKDMFLFDPRRHDFSDKTFLGYTIKGSGYPEVEEVLDIVCSSPKTAHFISKKIATYYVSDNPSEHLINQMSQTFLKTNGSIRDVLYTMITSSEFASQIGKNSKFKTPYQYMVSILKPLVNEQLIINYRPINNNINSLGQQPFSKQTPQGFGITAKDWVSSDQIQRRLEIGTNLTYLLTKSFTAPEQPDNHNINLNQDEISKVLNAEISQFDEKDRDIVINSDMNQKFKLIFGSPDWMYY